MVFMGAKPITLQDWPTFTVEFALPGCEVSLKTWIALLRGINVGGARTVPMKDLVTALADAGFNDVRTYIQSGNVVFQALRGTPRSIGTQIARVIEERFGFDVPVMTLSEAEVSAAIRANPFTQAISDPRTLHLCFLAETPSSADLASLTKLKSPNESFALKGKVFYLHTPDGAGNSKLAARVERALGVDTTCRNWRTVNQLLEMCAQQ
jgi:uncharacterized protein (DUF1697 family)